MLLDLSEQPNDKLTLVHKDGKHVPVFAKNVNKVLL